MRMTVVNCFAFVVVFLLDRSCMEHRIMSLKGPCIIAWFWVEFPKHLSQYYTASWSWCAHLARGTYIIIIYIMYYCYRYTCAHDIKDYTYALQ